MSTKNVSRFCQMSPGEQRFLHSTLLENCWLQGSMWKRHTPAWRGGNDGRHACCLSRKGQSATSFGTNPSLTEPTRRLGLFLQQHLCFLSPLTASPFASAVSLLFTLEAAFPHFAPYNQDRKVKARRGKHQGEPLLPLPGRVGGVEESWS